MKSFHAVDLEDNLLGCSRALLTPPISSFHNSIHIIFLSYLFSVSLPILYEKSSVFNGVFQNMSQNGKYRDRPQIKMAKVHTCKTLLETLHQAEPLTIKLIVTDGIVCTFLASPIQSYVEYLSAARGQRSAT
jgi:hypothetical protein